MCGIHAVISVAGVTEIPPGLRQSLCNRGPDHVGSAKRALHVPVEGEQHMMMHPRVSLQFTSTVLALRGDHVAKQPFEHAESGSVLCWNGEAWKLDGEVVDGNDGEALAAKLAAEPTTAHVLSLLRRVQGPFAFLYYDAPAQSLYFGRDRLGRRSLLVNQSEDRSTIAFSSIAGEPNAEWKEVEADGLYSACFRPQVVGGASPVLGVDISKHAWVPTDAADLVSSIGRFNAILPQGGEKLDFQSPSVGALRHHLTEALRLRVLRVPEPPNPQPGRDTRIAILFSGGLDCTVLAALAHQLLPSDQGVDLINVAFENPRVAAQLQKQPNPPANVYEACPDRLTGRKAFAELKGACNTRAWRFIAVDVPFQQAMAHKSQVVSLIYPHNTEMDLSIALALYFAGRGTGQGYTSQSEYDASAPSVATPARVLLSGLGADELFGGYSRHVAAYERRGYEELVEELKLDVGRIGQRNLGRDDRVLAHWGKEVRFPYLDEDFVKFAIALPVWEKCDFANNLESHGPDSVDPAKRVLRLLAHQLDLPSTAREKKRAIQFGSRTAKLERSTGRVKGTAAIATTT